MSETLRMLAALAVAALLMAAAVPAQQSAEVLTNQDVLTMTEAGVPPSIVESKIESTATEFDLSVDGLVALSKAGVEEVVLAAMAEAAVNSGPPGAGARRAPASRDAEQPTAAADSPGAGDSAPRIIRPTFLPGDTFSEPLSSGGAGPEMVVVSEGRFQMGCVSGVRCFDHETPVHQVTISTPFAISKYEVTFDDYDRFTTPTGRVDDEGWGRGRRPVINVSWDDAQKYVRWLSQQTGATYRLLTEAEWEYAARAGSSTAYSWGNRIGMGRAHCDYCDSKWDSSQTVPVGSFAANAWGLHDMHGNVWEWVEDCWSDRYAGGPANGNAKLSGDCYGRVLRSGSKQWPPPYVRSASRRSGSTGYRDDNIGLRVARTLTTAAPPATLTPAAVPAQQSAEVLTNQDILTMNEAGVPVSIIVSKIGSTASEFALPVDALVTLSKAGVEEAVLAAMVEAVRTSQGTQTTYLPGDTFSESLSSGGTGPEMVVIPAGRFKMGCIDRPEPSLIRRLLRGTVRCPDYEKPVRQVTIYTPLAVSKYEVTFDDYDRFTIPSERVDDAKRGRGRRPVVNVSWEDAQEYVRWLSKETGARYRLLTEAEWEYAARAGSSTAYSWGDEVGSGHANCGSCDSEWDYWTTAPVGSFPPNAWGLHDMHGNVSEWVEDCWNDSYEGAPSDGAAWLSGDCSRRGSRGGGSTYPAKDVGSASRSYGSIDEPDKDMGFRVARVVNP